MIFKTLCKDDKEYLQKMCKGIYLDGECYAFAIAISRGTGYRMHGLKEKETGVIRHAGVMIHEGTLFDARGYVADLKEFPKPFGDPLKYELVAVTEEDLYATRPIEDDSIGMAAHMAETLWPELPWNAKSRREKVRAFLEDLERLSQKHGFWIRAPLPTCWPLLALAGGDESYVAQPTGGGLTYIINRKLH